MLALADALGERADVTLAFRQVPGGDRPGRPVLAIEPAAPAEGGADDVAVRGLDPLAHVAYVRRLDAFAREHAAAFDVVLEKGWRLSGRLLRAFRRHGVPGVLVENDARVWAEPIHDVRAVARYVLHLAARAATRRQWRGVPIIAETEELKAMLVGRGADPGQVAVVGLGVDHRLFRPLDQARARRDLGLDLAACVVLYVGAMDVYHDLEPVIEGLARAPRGPELHVVGDGTHRASCEALARRLGVAARFHGQVPHARVPVHIAAADACVAAYRDGAFPGGVVPFSTLKVPEYMACGRAVVGNAGGQARARLEHGVSGFLLANTAAAWADLFGALPSRDRLAAMGRAAARAAADLTWQSTAGHYLALCEQVAGVRPAPPRVAMAGVDAGAPAEEGGA
jgi:glycosyltransferase involved in cell wall biosynthesis